VEVYKIKQVTGAPGQSKVFSADETSEWEYYEI